MINQIWYMNKSLQNGGANIPRRWWGRGGLPSPALRLPPDRLWRPRRSAPGGKPAAAPKFSSSSFLSCFIPLWLVPFVVFAAWCWWSSSSLGPAWDLSSPALLLSRWVVINPLLCNLLQLLLQPHPPLAAGVSTHPAQIQTEFRSICGCGIRIRPPFGWIRFLRQSQQVSPHRLHLPPPPTSPPRHSNPRLWSHTYTTMAPSLVSVRQSCLPLGSQWRLLHQPPATFQPNLEVVGVVGVLLRPWLHRPASNRRYVRSPSGCMRPRRLCVPPAGDSFDSFAMDVIVIFSLFQGHFCNLVFSWGPLCNMVDVTVVVKKVTSEQLAHMVQYIFCWILGHILDTATYPAFTSPNQKTNRPREKQDDCSNGSQIWHSE
jgi:hypothetical protein